MLSVFIYLKKFGKKCKKKFNILNYKIYINGILFFLDIDYLKFIENG